MVAVRLFVGQEAATGVHVMRDRSTPQTGQAVTDDTPYAFDAGFYRGLYPDLASMTDQEADDHFRRHGMSEGRQGSPLGCRSAFVERLGTLGSVLEIGPFCNPVLRGPHIRYLDMLDAGELRARATEIGLDPVNCPERIHHVGAIDKVDETFDGVVSCHSVEHQPDLIRHLEGIERILRPNGGRYHLIVPDKRYCFDHFLAESTIADVLQAHEETRTNHTLRSMIEHRALTTHNDPAAHWQGVHGEHHPQNQPDRVRNAIAEYHANSGYLDVHAWYFTPASFWNIMTTLHAIGLTRLKPVEIYSTAVNTLEFYAVMARS